jgi:hypothetical protein
VSGFSHDELVLYRANSPAWALLAHRGAPLVLAFLDLEFLTTGTRSVEADTVVEDLADYLAALRETDPEIYPKDASAYIGDWVGPAHGWLRRRRGDDGTLHLEPTAAVETAAAFVRSLTPRESYSTGTRLMWVRNLLTQITTGAATDPEARITALERERDDIDAKIEAVRAGQDEPLSAALIRERHEEAERTTRALIADLRQVEARMRDLDRHVRTLATTWDGPRAALLEEVFGSQDSIDASPQGQSWQSFWTHLLSGREQDEIRDLLRSVRDVPALAGRTDVLERMLRSDLFTAADATQRTIASISAQLRRFLDENYWVENRRVINIIRDILAVVLDERTIDELPDPPELPSLRADLVLPLERPLYTPKVQAQFGDVDTSTADTSDADITELLELSTLDLTRLTEAIVDTVTASAGPVSLGDVVAGHPLQDGVNELVGYLQVSTVGDHGAAITDGREHLAWTDADGFKKAADIPLLMFTADETPDWT